MVVIEKIMQFLAPRPTKKDVRDFLSDNGFTPETFARYFDYDIDEVMKWLDVDNEDLIPRAVGFDMFHHTAINPLG